MKKLFLSTLAVITLIALTSCSKISDLLTVDVKVDVPVDLNIPAGSSELKSMSFRSVDVCEELDIATNPTVIEYEKRIKEIAANGGKVTIELPGNSESVTLNNVQLKITNLDTNVILGTWPLESKIYLTGAEVTLGAPTSGSFADISAALDKKAKVNICLTGKCNYLGGYKMRLTLNAVIKAKVL